MSGFLKVTADQGLGAVAWLTHFVRAAPVDFKIGTMGGFRSPYIIVAIQDPMSDRSSTKTTDSQDDSTYTVVARRYRPKSFQELVGQEHISQALGKAIATGRVGHAYLFTGARGVGKTSSARIFAKALNAPGGPSTEPLNNDVSQAIDTGEDVDVIEIDAASNRGIDEIRQLRANVSVRPSRSRYKIYIIDEVHMLTNQAFNALLKTLEEPPEHVKFIFCTTDPEKVPITVLSRCQRFDFAPVRPDAIKQRLREICASEGFEAEDDALALLARRAAGSMRDSQSLLEQVMSFSSGKITTEQVHALLGTADETRLRELAEALVDRDGVAALKLVDKAINDGTDAGQFAEQTLGYLRDLMATAVGGGPDLLKVCNPTGYDALKQLADRWGLQTILAAVQLLDESLVRMRFSVQSQALFEVALIQISQLQDLATIAKVIEAVQHGGPVPAMASKPAARPAPAGAPPASAPPAPEKKNDEGLDLTALRSNSPSRSEPRAAPIAESSTASAGISTGNVPPGRSGANAGSSTVSTNQAPTIQIRSAPLVSDIMGGTGGASVSSAESVAQGRSSGSMVTSSAPSAESVAAIEQWKQATSSIDGMLGDFAGQAIAVEVRSPDQWIIVLPAGGNKTQDYCEAPARKEELQAALARVVGRTIQFSYRVQPGPAIRSNAEVPLSPTVARSQRLRQLTEHPLVSKLCELLQGEVVRVDPPAAGPASGPHTTLSNNSDAAAARPEMVDAS